MDPNSLFSEVNQPSVERWANFKFVALLSLTGLLSGLVTSALRYPSGLHGGYALGGVFGAFMGIALALSEMSWGVWKAVLLPVPTAIAYYISIMVAGVVEIYFPWKIWSTGELTPPEPVALFAGGFVGGFLVLGVVSMLIQSIPVHPRVGIETVVIKALAWSLMGGILGVIGWMLGPSLGMIIWSGIHGFGLTAPTETFQNALSETSHQFSLFVVWQTGMALVLSIMLLPLKTKSREGNSN
jgi:hypothetical protein